MLRDRFGLDIDKLDHDPDGEFGYRRSAKRVAHQLRGGLRLGSHIRRSHAFSDMSGCLVDHPRIEAAFAQIVEVCGQLNVRAYDEQTKTGHLRHVWAKTDGKQVSILLVLAVQDRTLARHMSAALGDIEQLSWCVQGQDNNSMRGDSAQRLHGKDTLRIELAGVAVEVTPQGFLQPNPRVAEMAYEFMLRDPQQEPIKGDLALDLYAGAGVTTARLRRSFAQVFACDAHAESTGRHGVETMSAETMLTEPRVAQARFGLILANPPRSGLGDSVCEQLRHIDGERLHIMSCSPASLKRDLERLTATEDGRNGAAGKADKSSGRAWSISHLRAFDTLPHTAHVEVVAQLVRSPIEGDQAAP